MDTKIALILCALAIAGIGGLLLSLRYPSLIFAGIFLLRPIVELCRIAPLNDELVQNIVNWTGIGTPLILFVSLTIRKALNSENKWLFLFLLFAFLSAIAHGLDSESGITLTRIFSPFVFIVFPNLFIGKDYHLKRFLMAIGFSIVLVWLGLALDWNRTNIHPVYGNIQDSIQLVSGETQPRMAAIYGVPTATAFWLFPFFAVAYLLFEIEKRIQRFIWLGIAVSLTCPLYFTFSRTAWLSCCALIICYNSMERRIKKLGVILSGLFAFSVFAMPNMMARWENLGTLQLRLYSWAGYIQSTLEQGFIGIIIGLGTTGLPDKNRISGDLFDSGSTGVVENSYIYIFAGMGLLALFAFAFLFLRVAKRAIWLSRKSESPLVRNFGSWSLSMLLAWAIMGMTSDMLSYPVINWYWYAFFGWCSMLYARSQSKALGKVISQKAA